jgi:hypothetical protein
MMKQLLVKAWNTIKTIIGENTTVKGRRWGKLRSTSYSGRLFWIKAENQ